MSQPGDHKFKKRRLDDDDELGPTGHFKASARFNPTVLREWTVSVAVPGSIVSEYSNAEQRIAVTGRLARALAIFSIDEVVVFDDGPADSRPPAVDTDGYTGEVDPCHFVTHLLSYLETPPFMRKELFPLHPNLRMAGQLPSLDVPHHPHKDEWLPYREGVTVKDKPPSGSGTLVDIGMKGAHVTVPDSIPPKTRVTLHIPSSNPNDPAEAMNPSAPRTEGGYYWGFSVRRCNSLSNVFTESPHEGGYDLSIGTSERGLDALEALPPPPRPRRNPNFKHLLIVFGGARGLEYAAMNDPELSGMGITSGRTRELFDHWVNVLPDQGCRAIRTDEALFIALTALRRLWYFT